MSSNDELVYSDTYIPLAYEKPLELCDLWPEEQNKLRKVVDNIKKEHIYD